MKTKLILKSILIITLLFLLTNCTKTDDNPVTTIDGIQITFSNNEITGNNVEINEDSYTLRGSISPFSKVESIAVSLGTQDVSGGMFNDDGTFEVTLNFTDFADGNGEVKILALDSSDVTLKMKTLSIKVDRVEITVDSTDSSGSSGDHDISTDYVITSSDLTSEMHTISGDIILLGSSISKSDYDITITIEGINEISDLSIDNNGWSADINFTSFSDGDGNAEISIHDTTTDFKIDSISFNINLDRTL